MKPTTDNTGPPRVSALPRFWPLLFPLTYFVHIAEEYFGGFPNWSARFLGFHLTPAGFLELNTYAFGIMLCGAVLAALFASLRWLVVPFATVTFINGSAHVIASVITVSYSPGAISGLTLWIPLGFVTLRRSYSHVPRKFYWAGICLGVLLQITVGILATRG